MGRENHGKLRDEVQVPPLEYVSPLKRFLHHDIVGSAFLLTGALVAMVMANTGLSHAYHHLLEMEVGITWACFDLIKPLHLWINDGLMALFFFLVGIEIKREILVGELSTMRQAMLPVVAALGGMIVPALIYFIINRGGEGSRGWGIPMATDIAFAAGCLAILKKRIPPPLMVFLVALAIVDDLGAVTIIAIFYTEQIAIAPLVIGISMIIISFSIGKLGVRQTLPYVLIGIVVWFAFLKSGVHATIAGVLLAFTIPPDARYEPRLFKARIKELLNRFTHAKPRKEEELSQSPAAAARTRRQVTSRQQGLIRAMYAECHHVEAPLQRIEHNLEPFCVYIIMPIFAFANSGVEINFSTLGHTLLQPVTVGVFLGLVLGKPAGIMLATYASVKTGMLSLPSGTRWAQIYGVSWLAAIGFTMSLFINELAFPVSSGAHAEELLAQGKVGIFLASIVAGVVGLAILRVSSPVRGS